MPSPLAQHAVAFDPVGDAPALAADRHVVAPGRAVDDFVDGPGQVQVEDPVEDRDVGGVVAPAIIDGGPRRTPRRGRRGREQGEEATAVQMPIFTPASSGVRSRLSAPSPPCRTSDIGIPPFDYMGGLAAGPPNP